MNLLKAYEDRCQEMGWVQDPNHLLILQQMSALYHAFSKETHWLKRLISSKPNLYKGVYLCGRVGRGKTYLMDLFYDANPLKHKIRWHFTEFMQIVHKLLRQFAQQKGQPIDQVGKHFARTYRLICLDEFQVTEIAEAMLLSRLFTRLIQDGVFIIITSNCSPEELYAGGLHYDRFEPFVQVINDNWKIVTLTEEDSFDYRRAHAGERQETNNCTDRVLQNFQRCFDQIKEQEGLHPKCFHIHEREICFDQATPTTLWVEFSDLCERAFGSAEYQAIATHYKTIFLVHVPQLTSENRDAVRRFITLIDCLYDRGVMLYLHSYSDPDHLYEETGPSALPFERTASRLVQMSKLAEVLKV